MTSLTEKYRPTKLDEIIGQDHVLKSGVKMIDSLKQVTDRLKQDKNLKINFLFAGPPGTGKTTAAICMAKELFGNEWKNRFLELNASDERGIDTIRNKVKRYARSAGRRILFLDEADALTSDAQHALRRIMEKYENCIFILSCNYIHQIIEPLQSRCAIYPFRKIPRRDLGKRLGYILKSEGIKISKDEQTKEALYAIVDEANGDMRKAINLLEQLINTNKELTKENVIMQRRPDLVADAFDAAFNGDFDRAIKTIEDAYIQDNYDVNLIINKLEQKLSSLPNGSVKIKLYNKLAELEYRCSVGSNPLIQLVGFLSYVWVVKHVPDQCPAVRS